MRFTTAVLWAVLAVSALGQDPGNSTIATSADTAVATTDNVVSTPTTGASPSTDVIPTDVPTSTDTGAGNGTVTGAPNATVTEAPATTTAPPRPPTYVQSSIWSYPQPPIPHTTNSAPASVFTASGGGVIANFHRPQTRHYNFNIGFSAGKPSGFLRRMTTINNQFPGPLIEANQGDTIVVNVKNNLDYPQGIHWHGITQNGTNWADGVPGISQCPIPAGGSFTYRFTLDSEWGTFWYHSHYGNTLADGVWGALIIHSKNDPLKKGFLLGGDFTDERIMYVNDFYHDQTDLIIPRMHAWGLGYRGANIPQMPDAILINGLGQENCSKAQPGVSCTQNSPAVIKGKIGTRIRFRVINPGSLTQIRISIDNHVLKVVEVDDTPIQPLFIHEIGIDPGQRYSFIVNLNQGGLFSSFWIRASVSAACVFRGKEMVGKAILRYTDWFGIAWSNAQPTTSAWPDLDDPLTAPCKDLDNLYTVAPLQAEAAPTNPYMTSRLDSSLGIFFDYEGHPFNGLGFNPYNTANDSQVSFTNYINNPLLRQIENGLTLNASRVASHTFPDYGVVDIIVNQRDIGLAHPFHLHGRKFYIVARGDGQITPDTVASANWNLGNPLRRDTLTIPSNSYAILRLITDTPGVWPIHCHIGWHLSEGKLAAMVVRPDAIKGFSQPAAWQGLCAGTDINEVAPGRRDYTPPQGRSARDREATLEEREANVLHIKGDLPTPVARAQVTAPPQRRADGAADTPYFSMDRTTFVLINSGITVTGTATEAPSAAANAVGIAASAPTGSDAADSYATLTNRPAGAVWSGLGAVATTVQASAGPNPSAAAGAQYGSVTGSLNPAANLVTAQTANAAPVDSILLNTASGPVASAPTAVESTPAVVNASVPTSVTVAKEFPPAVTTAAKNKHHEG